MSQFKNLFSRKLGAFEPMAKPVEAVRTQLQGAKAITQAAARGMLLTTESANVDPASVANMESFSTDLAIKLQDVKDALFSAKVDAEGKYPFGTLTHESRAPLAMAGMMMASDNSLQALAKQTLSKPNLKEFDVVVNFESTTGEIAHANRSIYTPEAFNNYDLDNSRIFSTLFNYSIVDFDDFIRTFWRPVTMSPDSSFVELLVNLLTVFNGAVHNPDGKSKPWDRVNLVRAIADHTILHTDLTRAIPAVNATNTEFFMDPALVAPTVIMQAGDLPVDTAPLKFNVPDMNLISLALPGWLTKTGELDQRDGLDPGVKLDRILIALGTDVLSFDVKGLGISNFNSAAQGDQQHVQLIWNTTSFPVDKDTKQADGSALVDLAAVVTGEYKLRIKMTVTFDLNIETGDLTAINSIPTIRSLKDKDGLDVAPADATYKAINTALAGIQEAGFVIEAYRSNADRRQRGQLINIRQFAENVVVPWRDPIAAERPAAGSTEQDTADLTALISATRIRIHNEGVTELLEAENVIRQNANGFRAEKVEIPATLGVGRYYVNPTYRYQHMDAMDYVDSLRSGERERDIQAAIVATLRNMLAHAYTDSQYKAAQDALTGGTGTKPKVALVCDPVVARYIIEPGELRTLVDFDLIVVPILDYRMRGKIRMVFVTDDGGEQINFLNFGYLFWSPEHVLVANMSRTGAYNRETQVQPRYRFYVSCPIMVAVDIENIELALKKMPLKIEGDITTTPAPNPGP